MFSHWHYPFLLDGVCPGSNGLRVLCLFVESDSFQGQVEGVEGAVCAGAIDSACVFLLWSRGIVGSEHREFRDVKRDEKRQG